jgi:hypothetical protein
MSTSVALGVWLKLRSILKGSLRKVVMSQKVAKAYLDRVSTAASTLTVYFSGEDQLSRFLRHASSEWGKEVTSSRGFDYITFLSLEQQVIDAIYKCARDKGLDTAL